MDAENAGAILPIWNNANASAQGALVSVWTITDRPQNTVPSFNYRLRPSIHHSRPAMPSAHYRQLLEETKRQPMAPTDLARRSLAHVHSHARGLHSHGHAAHDHVARDSVVSRSDDTDQPADKDDGSDNMINLLIIILGILFILLILTSMFFLFRRQRRQRQQKQQQHSALPSYDDAAKRSNPHGLTIETTLNGRSSVVVFGKDGQPMLQNPNSPPHSPDNVPQIHITFPDETDEKGHHKDGRVLVVRVGDNATIGLEPVQEEQLPAYEKDAKTQFYSIDMDQIGGLKEKDPALFK